MVKTELIDLKQGRTTVWIRRGTRDMLDRIGNRKDTYDQIIRTLIRKTQVLEKQLESVNQDRQNLIKISTEQQGKSRIEIRDGYIEYVYNVPTLHMSRDFRFRVHYARIVFNNAEVPIHGQYSNAYEMARDYLKIIEQIIINHIDPMFKIEIKMMLDLGWWKRMILNLDLPETVFNEDIQMELIKLGFAP